MRRSGRRRTLNSDVAGSPDSPDAEDLTSRFGGAAGAAGGGDGTGDSRGSMKRKRGEEGGATGDGAAATTTLCSPLLFASASPDAGKTASRIECSETTALTEYLNFVANRFYNTTETPMQYGSFASFRRSMLGQLTSRVRKVDPADTWSPYEIAKFEAAICTYGKVFHAIQRVVKTKTVKEVIEFYYLWKMTPDYKQWKQVFHHSSVYDC